METTGKYGTGTVFLAALGGAAVGAVVPFYDDEGNGCNNLNTFNIGDRLSSESIIARMHSKQCP